MPAGRRHHDRRLHPRAEQAHAGVDLDDVAQHARAELELPPRRDVLLGRDLVVGAGVAEHPRFRPHHPLRVLLQRIQIDAVPQHEFALSRPLVAARHHAASCLHHRNALSRRATPWQAWRLPLPGVFHAVRPPVHRRQAQDLPRAAQVRLLRHSQSVECRQRALSAGPRLQGAGDDQLRPRPFRRLSRRRAIAWTTCWRTTASSRRRPTFRSTPISRTALPTIPTAVAANVTRCIATGVAGLSIEDSPQQSDDPLYDFDAGAGARQGGARGDRQGRRRRGVHRAHRGLHPRPARHRRDHPAAEGLRRRRRRLPLFARHQDPRAHRGDREGGRRQGDQLPQQRRARLHGERSRRHGRAAHQRRRHAGAGGDGRLHQVGARRSPRRASSTASPASSPTPSSTSSSATTARTGHDRRIGAAPRPASRSACRSPTRRPAPPPGPVTLARPLRPGRAARRQHHDAALWEAVRGHDGIWTYMSSYGPFADVARVLRLDRQPAAARGSLFLRRGRAAGRAVGIVTLMEIRPAMRVIEVGHIVYSPALQRTPLAHRGAVSAGALRVRDARLPALRMEMQRAQRAVAPRGAALRLRATKASSAST